MTTFVLTWDGSAEGYDPAQMADDITATAAGQVVQARWSVGTRRGGMSSGDRVVLLRQHGHRGILAVGRIDSGEIYEKEHWAIQGQTARYVNVTWDVVMPTDERLPTEELLHVAPSYDWNHVFSGGQRLSDAAEAEVTTALTQHLSKRRTKVLVIWSSSGANGVRNLQFGLENEIWGFKADPGINEPFGYVLFAQHFSGGNVRVDQAAWAGQTVDLILGETSGVPYRANAPLWPDEVEHSRVIYPHRFGFTPLGDRSAYPLSTGTLGPRGAAAMRRAAIASKPELITMTVGELLEAVGVSEVPGRATAAMSDTEVTTSTGRGPALAHESAGRSDDPKWRAAVEKHAVAMAISHMKSLGWLKVNELGKPYDLVCTSGPTTERHVEVKGTSTAGAAVEFTSNEVKHFRECPYGADLVVVRDITVDTTSEPYSTSGGTMMHLEDYVPDDADLVPIKYRARIKWQVA